MNFALTLAGNGISGVTLSSPAPSTPSSPEQEEHRLEHTILGEPVSDRTRTILLEQSADATLPAQAARDFLPAAAPSETLVAASSPSSSHQTQTMTGLLLGSPEFQRR